MPGCSPGRRGIGKARFAERGGAALSRRGRSAPVAERRGSICPTDHPTARFAAAGSHPDYRRLERLLREKTGDHARSITVDQVRGLQGAVRDDADASRRAARW